jgi:tRNA A37 methylthiotransferase MiaB
MMKTAKIIYAHGCKRADAEINLVNDYLIRNGFQITKDIKKADMLFVCTCGFDASSEIVSLNILSKAANAMRPDATLVAFGCLAGINEKAIKTRCGDHVITVPPKNLNSLDGIIDADVNFKSILDEDQKSLFYVKQDLLFKANNGYLPACTPDCVNVNCRNTFTRTDRLLAKFSVSKDLLDKFISRIDQIPRLTGMRAIEFWIPSLLISIGCPGECTYCGIRKAAGPLHSIPLQTVISRFEHIIAQGNKLIALVAADVGAYGQDIEMNIVHLLDKFFAIEKDYMLLISDFHPRWLIQYSDDVIRLLSQNQNRIEHISIPIQSGSDKILSLMKRHVSSTEIKTHVKKLKQAAPNIPITTHVLVGFPGESDDDFNQTLELLHEVDFDDILAFSYTDRLDTPSSHYSKKISRLTKIHRLLALKHQFRRKQKDSQFSYVNRLNCQSEFKI